MNEHPEDVSLNKTITISFEQAADLEIKKVTSSLPFVEVTQTAITPNQRYSIQVKIKPPVKEGDFSGTHHHRHQQEGHRHSRARQDLLVQARRQR